MSNFALDTTGEQFPILPDNTKDAENIRLLLTPEESSKRLGLTRRKLYLLWAQGDGPRRVRIGSRVYCTPKALVEFVVAHEEPVDAR